MKHFLLSALLQLLIVGTVIPQTDTTISDMKGFIDNNGNIQLLYSTKHKIFNSDADSSFYTHSIYDVELNSNTKLLGGYEIEYYAESFISSKQINNIEFFNNDPNKYIYSTNIISIDTDGSISRYDSMDVYSNLAHIKDIHISHNDTNIVYAIASDYIIKSTDGGNTWEESYQLNEGGVRIFHLAFSTHNEAELFGINSSNQLLKSVDTGRTYSMVSNELIWSNSTEFIFDKDGIHIYAITNRCVSSYENGTLSISDNKGDAFSWSVRRYESNNMSLCINDSLSGEVYFSLGNKIYKSSDYCSSLDLYLEIPHPPAGMYFSYGNNNLYAAMPDGIIEIKDSNCTYLIKKSIINALSLFPLSVGNKWFYNESGSSWDIQNPDPFDYNFTEEITRDSIFSNGHRYYSYLPKGWLRVDSTNGIIYEKRGSNVEDEITFIDLVAEGNYLYETSEGDVYNTTESDTLLWNRRRTSKRILLSSLFTYEETFVQDVGIVKKYNEFDFGNSETTLQGCIVDGVVYGDTSGVTDFFPLKIGNRWQYSENGGDIQESRVIGDTLMPNSKKYTIIEGVLFSGYYRKVGQAIFSYNTSKNDEKLEYHFSFKEGDIFKIEPYEQDTLIIRVSSVGYTEIFGETRKSFNYIYEWVNSSEGYEERFINGIGFSQNYGLLPYSLTGAVIDGVTYGAIVNVENSIETLPTQYSLSQNYPNPFNPSTTISYSIPGRSFVDLKVFDVLGRVISELVNKEQSAGNYDIQFDASNFGSGIYFYKLAVGSFVETKKMILLK